ncbi:S41 family peptidase [Pseudoduganella lutea]|uniref:S41 family peptidase n=1 Tax=Pseudoduganella lutea TaxID=321985 RepID=A0A4V0Z3K6_9BURK|nr:S41 family peptidase [Pseudoduganella lutea]QBE63773.1 S41 family peptidase [Pseudoduganella lutea]
MKRWISSAVLSACAATLPCHADESLTLPKEEFEQMLGSYQLVLKDYVGTADSKKLLTEAIRGMLSSLDPHSRYLDKDDLEDLERIHSGAYVGIGVGVEMLNGQVLVRDVAENGPADKAGIRAGDSIVAIDGAPLFGLRDNQIARRMHGEPGTSVEVTLAKRGNTPLRTLSIPRITMHENTVTVQRLEGNIARIRITEFGGGTAAELVAALRQLDGPRRVEGIVLDLRNNPGGLLPAAVAVAGAFLPQGAVVFSSTGRLPESNSKVTVSPRFFGTPDTKVAYDQLPAFAQTVPLAVLVNGSSASAAELLAGAIQDHGRGKIVGARTYGKGSIQAVFPLSDESAIKLTIARYFTPNGREVQAQGIEPDVEVAQAEHKDGDDNLLFREADMANHLPASSVSADAETRASERPVAEDSKVFGSASDRALQAALAQLHPAAPSGQALGSVWRGISALFRTNDS